MRPIDAEELLEHLEACLQNGRPLSNLYDLSEIVRYVKSMPTVAAPRWHRVEKEPKEHGPFLCAAKHEHNGQTHWFFELCWYADGDLKDVVFDAEQDSGFYSWSASQDRDIDAKVDYWMPIEPPKEDEHGN